MERTGDAAQRTKPGAGQVGYRAVGADDHRLRDMVQHKLVRMLGQRTAVEHRARLVRPESRGSPAGQHDAKDMGIGQRVLSIRTGTDFPAGTWLSRAWWETGIRMLHSG